MRVEFKSQLGPAFVWDRLAADSKEPCMKPMVTRPNGILNLSFTGTGSWRRGTKICGLTLSTVTLASNQPTKLATRRRARQSDVTRRKGESQGRAAGRM